MIEVSQALQDAFEADVQYAKHRVLARVADSKFVDNLESSSNDHRFYDWTNSEDLFSVDQAMNTVEGETFAWCVLDSLDKDGLPIKANGTTYVLPDHKSDGNNYGWWSKAESDANGDFAGGPYPRISFEFDQRKCSYVEVHTSYDLGRIKQFQLSYKNSYNTWVVAGTFTNQVDEWVTVCDLGGDLDIQGLKVVVLSTHNPNDLARIYEVVPVYEVDLTDRVVSFDLNQERESYDDGSSPVGNLAASSGSITFDNTDKYFNVYNDNDIADYIRPDVRLDIEVGWVVDGGGTEYVKYGTFYVDQWSFSTEMEVTAQVRDYARFLQEKTLDEGVVYEQLTMSEAMSNLAKVGDIPTRRIDIVDSHYNLINTLGPQIYLRCNDFNYINPNDIKDSKEPVDITKHDKFYVDRNQFKVVDEASMIHASLSGGGIGRGRRSITEAGDYSLLMVGNDGSRVLVDTSSDSSRYELKDQWTLSFMIMLRYLPDAGQKYCFYARGNSNTYANLDYYLDMDEDGDLTFGFKKATGNFTHKFSSSIPIRVPTHVMICFNSDKDYVKCYIDGTLIESFSTTDVPSNAGGGDLTIGTNSDQAGNDTMNAFISNIAAFHRDLSLNERNVVELAKALKGFSQPTFPYLFGKDDTVWGTMLEWSIADLGHFYFDQDNQFVYDSKEVMNSKIHDDKYFAQYEFSDDTNIISSEFISEIQTNKVNVSINPMTTLNSGVQAIWRAQEGESLVVSSLRKTLHPGDNYVDIESTENPLWPEIGYFKVGEEIVKYSGKDTNRLYNLERDRMDGNSLSLVGKSYEYAYCDPPFRTQGGSNPRTPWFYNYSPGRIEVAMRLTPVEWRPSFNITLCGQWEEGERSWRIRNVNSGQFQFHISTDGTASSAVYTTAETNTFSDWESVWLLFDWDGNDGAGNSTFDVYYSYDDTNDPGEVSWQSFGAQVVKNTTYTIHASEAILEVGSTNRGKHAGYVGRVHAMEVKGDGTTHARPIFANQSTSTTTFRDSVYTFWRFHSGGSDGAMMIKRNGGSYGPGTLIREAREYNIEYTQSPAINVRYPLITAVQLDRNADIDEYVSDAYGAKMVVSAGTFGVASGDTIVLEGTHPVTGLRNHFALAGIPLVENSSQEEVSVETAQIDKNIRRYGEKDLSIENKFVQDKKHAIQMARFLIDFYSEPISVINMDIVHVPTIELGDRVVVKKLDQLDLTDKQFWVISKQLTYNGTLESSMTLRAVPSKYETRLKVQQSYIPEAHWSANEYDHENSWFVDQSGHNRHLKMPDKMCYVGNFDSPFSFNGLSPSIQFPPSNTGAYLGLPGISGATLHTPDSATVSPTGDFRVYMKVACKDWADSNKSLISKESSTTTRSFDFFINDNKLNLSISSDGSTEEILTSTATLDLEEWEQAEVEFTYRASDCRVQFFVDKVQLGADVTGATNSIFDSTSDVYVGSNTDGTSGLSHMRVTEVEMYSGIARTPEDDVLCMFNAENVQDLIRGEGEVLGGSGEVWFISSGSTSNPTFIPARFRGRTRALMFHSGEAGDIIKSSGSNFDLTGDHRFEFSGWLPSSRPSEEKVIASRWQGAGGRMFRFYVDTNGYLNVGFSIDGTTQGRTFTSTRPIGPENNGFAYSFDASNAYSDAEVTFYVSTRFNKDWVQLGLVRADDAFTIYDPAGDPDFEIGSQEGGTNNVWSIATFSAQLYSDTEGDSTSAFFRAYESSKSGYTSTTGETWSVVQSGTGSNIFIKRAGRGIVSMAQSQYLYASNHPRTNFSNVNGWAVSYRGQLYSNPSIDATLIKKKNSISNSVDVGWAMYVKSGTNNVAMNVYDGTTGATSSGLSWDLSRDNVIYSRYNNPTGSSGTITTEFGAASDSVSVDVEDLTNTELLEVGRDIIGEWEESKIWNIYVPDNQL